MVRINLHKYYYKDYFDLDKDRKTDKPSKYEYIFESSPKGDNGLVNESNSLLTGISFSHKIGSDYYPNTHVDNECYDNNMSFKMTISYPGLVTGVGINHEAKIEGEFKLGVHFDYTYGMPVVYGSSVKGVLRAWFKDIYLEKNIGQEKTAQMLFDDIFNGIGADGKPKSIYDRDIFFDAVLVKADPKGRILCSDSITPHGDNPLKNPMPITFMKIAPGCELEFRFKLVDTKGPNGNVIFSKAQKKALFEEILKTVGIGAKTNVGYGQFQ